MQHDWAQAERTVASAQPHPPPDLPCTFLNVLRMEPLAPVNSSCFRASGSSVSRVRLSAGSTPKPHTQMDAMVNF